MKALYNMIFLMILTSCGGNSIPLIQSNGAQLLEKEQYEEFMVDKLAKTNHYINASKTTDLYLKHITIGFSLDIRVGLFGWNKGVNNSIEFHIAPPTKES